MGGGGGGSGGGTILLSSIVIVAHSAKSTCLWLRRGAFLLTAEKIMGNIYMHTGRISHVDSDPLVSLKVHLE